MSIYDEVLCEVDMDYDVAVRTFQARLRSYPCLAGDKLEINYTVGCVGLNSLAAA